MINSVEHAAKFAYMLLSVCCYITDRQKLPVGDFASQITWRSICHINARQLLVEAPAVMIASSLVAFDLVQ